MRGNGFRSLLLTATAMGWLLTCARAGDLKILLPKRSKETPVQQLNREGVKQVQKRNLKKAKQLFYKAYLLDPDDPFTLNNLGYISELEGNADRALRYYELSSKNSSQAVIAVASRPALKGRPLQDAFRSLQVPDLEANKANVQAISLLSKGRVTEAEVVLEKALALDPHNSFTLNNMGYVREAEGDLQSALRDYSSAASLHSNESILVAPNPKWRGRGISEVASENARAVNETISKGEDLNAQVARLNLRGVAALNHNDAQSARDFFEQAYKLDPKNAFSLNNMGYLSELEGDRETAETYYEEAHAANNMNQRVTYATRREAEGLKMGDVARDNQTEVEANIAALQAVRRREGAPIPQLKRRDNTPVPEPEVQPSTPLEPAPPQLPPLQLPDRTEQWQPQTQQPELLPPLPESHQPPSFETPAQSPTQPPPPQQAQPETPPGLMPPLPESQQPPAARTPPQSSGQQQPPQSQQAQPETPPGLMPPLPESQQPPGARTAEPQPPTQQQPPQAPPQ